MEINIFSVFVIVGMAIWIAVQNERIKKLNKTIEQSNEYYRRLHNQNVVLTQEFEKAKGVINNLTHTK